MQARSHAGMPINILKGSGANTNHCSSTSQPVVSISMPSRLAKLRICGHHWRACVVVSAAIFCSGCISVRRAMSATPPTPTPLQSQGLSLGTTTTSSSHQLIRSSAPSATSPSAISIAQRSIRVSQLRSRATLSPCEPFSKPMQQRVASCPSTVEISASAPAAGQFRLWCSGLIDLSCTIKCTK